MRTSREAFNRIQWDTRLDHTAFVIGYRDFEGNDGVQETPLTQWDSSGEVPWHRIQYIRCGNVFVWDREQKIDHLASEELPAEAWAGPPTPVVSSIESPQVEFVPCTVYQHTDDWQPVTTPPQNLLVNRFRVATFNVLCDQHESDLIESDRRWPVIVDELRRTQADIIALQEATPELLTILLQQPWIRREYVVSEVPPMSSLRPYGLLLLSRMPFTLTACTFSDHKRVLVGTWQFNDRSLYVAVLHLPSNRAANASVARIHQLGVVLEHLRGLLGDALLVGDTNAAEDELTPILDRHELIDVWRRLHPTEPGFTFDTQRNTLAALMSLTGQPQRFDRVLFRSAQDPEWRAERIERFATEPFADTSGQLFPSDHYGLCAEFGSTRVTDLTEVRPVYQSAIVVLPSPEAWPAIQAVRERFDRQIDRWPPHINLLYGFVPEAHFAEAAARIAPVLAKHSPFTITLADYQSFSHRKSCTAWLRPVAQPESSLHELQQALHELFPQCEEQSTKSATGYTPHLSVGQFAGVADLRQLPAWDVIAFPIESIALIARRGNEPFAVRYRIGIGGECHTAEHLNRVVDRLAPELTPAQRQQRQEVLAEIERASSAIAGASVPLHTVGSTRLDVQSQDSDLDVVALVSSTTFLDALARHLTGQGLTARVASNAKFPALRLRHGDIRLDLLAAIQPPGVSDLSASRELFDPASWLAYSAVLEAEAIEQAVGQHVPMNAFRRLLRGVRAWAKARQLYGNAWGYLGGFSWTLLAAWSCTQGDASLAGFFRRLNGYDWTQSLTLTEVSRGYQPSVPPDWLPIVTPVEPIRNSARNVTRSTCQTIRDEFARAADIVERIENKQLGWEDLFEPIHLPAVTDMRLTLWLRGEPATLTEAAGLLEGQILGLILDLETKAGAGVRPWPGVRIEGDAICCTLGVTAPQTSHTAIRSLGQAFLHRLFGTDAVCEATLS